MIPRIWFNRDQAAAATEEAAAARLAARYGLAGATEALATTDRDPALARLFRREAVAGLFTQAANAAADTAVELRTLRRRVAELEARLEQGKKERD